MFLAALIDEGKELGEKFLGSHETIAKGAPHGEIVGKCLTQDVHAASPGQGRAIVRRASRLTLA